MKKFKWPKFLNLSRTLLLTVLVLVVGYLLIYFLGGYKEATQSKDMQEFVYENFESYEKSINNIINTKVKDENDAFVEACKVLNKNNYKDEIKGLIEQIVTVTNGDHLKSILATNKTSWGISDNAFSAYKKQIEGASDLSDTDRAEQFLDKFELLFKNDNYAFYFNKRYTTFKIDLIKNGNVSDVVYSWYSNPQNEWSNPTEGNAQDPNGRGGSDSIIYNQQSPLILQFLTKSGDIKKFSVYEHAISDRSGTGDNAEVIMPSFEIKIDEENHSIQVLYRITKKGLSYADFPKAITVNKYNNPEPAEDEETLVQRNQKMVNELIETIDGYYDNNDLASLQQYVNQHKSIRMTYNYFKSISDYVGRYAYDNYARLTGKGTPVEADKDGNAINQNEYLDKIDSILDDIDELYQLACEMVRVEFLWNYKTSDYSMDPKTQKETGFYSKDEAALRGYYSEVKTQTVQNEEGEDVEEKYYELTPYNRNLPKPVQKDLNQLLYKKLGYTKQDLEADNTYFNVVIEDIYIECDIAVEYKLTEQGLKVTVLNDSIKETQPEVYPLYKVDLLPYFTSEICEIEYDGNTYQTNGGMIIPDGSGAYISLNNGKTLYSQYSKPVYSTDLAFGSEVEKTASQDILLPMYGFITNSISDGTNRFKNSASVLARVSKGAGQAVLSSSISKVSDSYNNIYYSTTYRESQLVKIGTGYYQKEITRFTDKLVTTDTVVDYYLYASENKDYTYSDLAKLYQTVLLNEGILSEEEKDVTDQTVLNAELLGVYDYTTNFLGIVYDGHDTLTTYNEALTILDSLKTWGAKNINVLYRGWRDGGLVNETFKDMSFANKLGSKKEYENFTSKLEEENIDLYPITSFLEIHKYNDSFGKNRYSTRDISNEYTKKYPYHLAGNIYDKKQRGYYTLSPRYFEVFAEILSENFHKSNPELNSMAFENLGSNLVGDYKKRNVFYKQDSLNETIKAFETFEEVGEITNISLNAPYEFAIKYADNITNLSYDSTLYEVFDYSIPFYQLVLSGYKDYSGLVINANDEIALDRHMMNILMSGSNVHFTLSYENSSKLIQTDYNYYYYTQYSQWEKEVSESLSILETYGIHKYALQSHNPVKDVTGKTIDKVYVVTYANKINPQDTFQVFLNYSDKPAQIVDRTNSTITLNSWSYIIDKEVN